jgi:hypothetical protein
MPREWEKKEIAMCSQPGCLDLSPDRVQIGTHYHLEGWHNWQSAKMNPDDTTHCRNCGTLYTLLRGAVVRQDDSVPARLQPPVETDSGHQFEPEF